MANEKRLIDANKAKFYIADVLDIFDVPVGDRMANRLIETIDALPVVDAVEVVYGRWEKASETMPIYHCSICKERNLFKNGNNVLSNFCPHCGADMRGNDSG